MKYKTTAIAMAIVGTVAAPVAVQAGEDEVYASARVGIWNVDQDGTGDLDVRSFDSYFGMRGETELGNGLSGFGRYEFNVDMNDGGSISDRHRYVGLKGDWGSVLIGQTYHTWYNYVVGPLDIPWWHSGYAMVDYRGRTDKAITYAGGGGAINYGVTAYFAPDVDENAPDTIETGISFGLGDSTIGVAYSGIQNDSYTQGSADTDDDIFGVAWSGIGIGGTNLGVSYMNQEDDDGFVIDWLFGDAYFHAEMLSVDATDQDIVSLTLGYTQNLGRKTSLYYEVNNVDMDADSDADRTAIMAVLTYDII